MAVAIQIDFPGATLEQYEELNSRMGFRAQGAGAKGCLFHWVAKTPGGIPVVDVWHRREEFDAFAREKIGPLTQAVGVARPELAFFEVHHYLTAG